MTKKKNEVDTEKEVSTEPKYSIEKLRSNCLKLFGVTTSTFDGATHGLNGEYTVKEMKNVIDKWRNTTLKKEANK